MNENAYYNGLLSSSTLFHFTNKIENLKSILENGFYPHLADEDISNILPNYKQTQKAKISWPMICFCDIPFFLSKKHQARYGYFAIELKKNWGIENKLNPVMYLNSDTIPQQSFFEIQKWIFNCIQNSRDILDEFSQKQAIDEHEKESQNIVLKLIRFCGYIKLYTEKASEKPYYDEREWRYFPPVQDMEFEEYTNILVDDSINEDRKKNVNERLKKYPLKFSPCDVRHIIVTNEKEKSELKKYINESIIDNVYIRKIITTDERLSEDKEIISELPFYKV